MITIVASFTVEPVQPILQWLMDQAGLSRNVTLAPYGQVFQELLDPASYTARQSKNATVVVVRLGDFLADRTSIGQQSNQLTLLTEEFAGAVESFVERSQGPVFLVLLPTYQAEVLELELDLTERMGRLSKLTILSLAALNSVADLKAAHDPLTDQLAHVPYTDIGYAGLALALTRLLHATLLPAQKVLVLDCDNTIWGGVVGEDGCANVILSQPFLALQRFALRKKQEGVLLCLASKNVEADVNEVFETRSEMVLRPDDIVSQRVNWQSKAQNIESLAAELNLGLDSFVFIDDNPVECGQMREALPQVVTLLLPAADKIQRFLDHLWMFDKKSVTDEDARRTEMYRESRARQELEKAAPSIGNFIASLGLNIDIDRPGETEWARVSQLSYRTNQFNFTTLRRTEEEMRAFSVTPGHQVLRVRVCDRFGDYGLVGVVLTVVRDGCLYVDSLMLSCRVLGRGVEHAMLRHLAEAASSRELAMLSIKLMSTSKNEPARAFAESVVARWRLPDNDPNIAEYLVPVLDAKAIQHRPGEDPEAVVAAARTSEKPAAVQQISPMADRSMRYQRLACELTDGPTVLAAMRTDQAKERDLTHLPTPSSTASEQRLTVIWERLFNMKGLGVNDDFDALGGTSLMAARLFADVEREFGLRLRLTTIVEFPTIRQLALIVDQKIASNSQCRLVNLRSGDAETLFMIHDGDGETLLYRNLSQRLPPGIAVIGVEPLALAGIPLAHTSIESMAAHYVSQIRSVQPKGPYRLGGMCAGGLIAFEMAQQLLAAGESVAQVLMLDTAVPNARQRGGRLASARANRIRELRDIASRRFGSGPLGHLYFSWGLCSKALNAMRWELGSLLSRRWTALRYRVLHLRLKDGRRWPGWLPSLTVRQIINAAEVRYRPKLALQPKCLLLVRATAGMDGDIPFCEVYEEPEFGWRELASGIEVADVEGGHASMLQEPWVASLSSEVIKRWHAIRSARDL